MRIKSSLPLSSTQKSPTSTFTTNITSTTTTTTIIGNATTTNTTTVSPPIVTTSKFATKFIKVKQLANGTSTTLATTTTVATTRKSVKRLVTAKSHTRPPANRTVSLPIAAHGGSMVRVVKVVKTRRPSTTRVPRKVTPKALRTISFRRKNVSTSTSTTSRPSTSTSSTNSTGRVSAIRTLALATTRRPITTTRSPITTTRSRITTTRRPITTTTTSTTTRRPTTTTTRRPIPATSTTTRRPTTTTTTTTRRPTTTTVRTTPMAIQTTTTQRPSAPMKVVIQRSVSLMKLPQSRGKGGRKIVVEETTTMAPVTTPRPEVASFPLATLLIALLSLSLLVCFLIGFYCYRKKKNNAAVKIGQVMPVTPPEQRKQMDIVSVGGSGTMSRKDSIESLKYNSPSPAQRVFSIDSNEKAIINKTVDNELFTRTEKALQVQQLEARAASKNSTGFRNFFSGRSSPLSCCAPSDKKLAAGSEANVLLPGEVPSGAAVYTAPSIEGDGEDGGLSAVSSRGNSLLPPVEGKVPFNKDLDGMSLDSETEEGHEKGTDKVDKDKSAGVAVAGTSSEGGGEKVGAVQATSIVGMFKAPPPKVDPKQVAGKNMLMAMGSKLEQVQSTSKRTGGRKKSAGCQTSPTRAGSSICIPGLVESPDSMAFDRLVDYDGAERKYFIYLVSDGQNAVFRKDCIGRLVLPPKGQHLTLSDLRSQLLKSDDEELRAMVRANKQFRFVTETYRFVAQNESMAPIDDVYPTQGIFIKFTEGANVPDHFKSPSPHPPAGSRRAGSTMPTFLNPATGNGKGRPKSSQSRLGMSKKDRQEMDQQGRSDALRRRHVECISPLPIKHKNAQRRLNVLTLDVRRRCDNVTCNNRPVFKCAKCSVAAYCGARCKKDHWVEHRMACTRPPWRL